MERMQSEWVKAAEVCQMFGDVSRVTIWRWVKAGKVPAPVMISPRAARWVRAECEAAKHRMIEARKGAQ